MAFFFLHCVQVGVAINGDATRLRNHYGVEMANTVDLRTYARSCWVKVATRSLAGMVFTVLGKSLPKKVNVRFSCWSAERLTEAQVSYAAPYVFLGRRSLKMHSKCICSL